MTTNTHPSEQRVAEVVGKLTLVDRVVIRNRGYAYGRAPFAACVVRPLIRDGLFYRVTEKGFQTHWQLTPLGRAVRAALLSNKDQ